MLLPNDETKESFVSNYKTNQRRLQSKLEHERVEGRRDVDFQDFEYINKGSLWINETLQPTVKVELEVDPYSLERNLDFEWTLTAMDENEMVLQVKFNESHAISMGDE